MMVGQEEFERLVPPPERVGDSIDWANVEDRLGVGLPLDYKWLVERYGPGVFDGFLHLFHPSYPRPARDLEHQRERAKWALEYLEGAGISLPRSPSEVFAVGISDNGDTVYWLTSHSDNPNEWKIAVGEGRGNLWDEFNGGLADWLRAVLSREHRVNIFPKTFPSRMPRFKPYAREQRSGN